MKNKIKTHFKRPALILLAAVCLCALLGGCGSLNRGSSSGRLVTIDDTSGTSDRSAPGSAGSASDRSAPDAAVPSGRSSGSGSADTRDIAGDSTTLGDLTAFSAETIDGGSFTNEDLSAYDVTMVNFWSTTCGPCISEMPELEELREQLPENVQLITVCLDGVYAHDDAAAILNMTGWDGVTIVSFDGDMYDIYGRMMYTPTTLCFDSEGRAIGTAIIGSPSDAVGTYADAINSLLDAMGLETFTVAR